MYSAYGRGNPRKLPNGDLVVEVEIIDDRTNQRVRVEKFTGRNANDIRRQAREAVKALADSEQDAALNAAFTDVLIASV